MTVRPPRADEAAALAELASAGWPEPVDAHAFERDWTSPLLDPERDARVAEGAYAAVWIEGDDDKAWLELHGEPSPELLAWAEGRAAERGVRRVLTGAWSDNEALLEALARGGYRPVRHSYRMLIDLDGSSEPPVWPEGVELRTFEPGDEGTFYAVHDETFEDSWEHSPMAEDEWRHWMLDPRVHVPDLWFLASAGGEPAGIAICHPHATRPEIGWVGILGVRRPWRRRGLGRALLLHAFAEFRRRGLRRAALGVDAESLTGANRLYEQVGMRVAHRFDHHEKPLG